MMLNFFKDIILEATVIIITFLLWHKENVSTSDLIKFITEKTIDLIVSSCKWYATLKWYVQLQRITKIRRFTIIARRSIANIVNVPGRIGRSLDDECLGITIIRRGKYASLLNLNRSTEKLSNSANSKSLSTLVTEDTNGTSDYNSDGNDLSVAEKSMRILNVTAEDVMDARARIYERSYWEEQEAIAKTSKLIEEIISRLPIEKYEAVTEPLKSKQTIENNTGKLNRALKKESIVRFHSFEKTEDESDTEEIIQTRKKDKISINERRQPNVLEKNIDVASGRIKNDAKLLESRDTYLEKKRKERKEVGKIVQHPSFQNNNEKNVEVFKLRSSSGMKLEIELSRIPVNGKEKPFNRADQRRQASPQLVPSGSGASQKEYEKNSKTCACHRALRSKKSKRARPLDNDGRNVECDTTGKELGSFTPIVNMQRSKLDKAALKYSEMYRLKKQLEKSEESREKQFWGSKSLAETAYSSGHARNTQIETRGDSMTCDILNERLKLKCNQMRNKRLIDSSSNCNNVSLFKEINYAEVHETKMRTLEACKIFALKKKIETRARKRHDLLLASRKLSIEEGKTMELRALKAYNELTLLKNKKELNVRKKCDSFLNYGELKSPKVSRIKVSKTSNDPLPEDKNERPRKDNLSPSSRQLVDKRSAPRVCNEIARSGRERELCIERKRDLLRKEIPSECEDIEASTSASNRLSTGSYKSVTIPVRRNESGAGFNDRCARQAHMSLNLMEIARNIECTVYPRGITLVNKYLHGQFLDGGLRESQQRDIVDDDTAGTLHGAFFFKPEIITRVFQHTRTSVAESFFNFAKLRRENFDTEFVCRMSNEMIVCNRDTSFDLERMMGSGRGTPADTMCNVNENRGTRGERGHDLCIIFIGREQMANETGAASVEDSTTVGPRENTRSSIEDIRTTNNLILDVDRNRADSVINDNLPIQLLADVLRNFNTETSEAVIRDIASPLEEHEVYVSNANTCNNFQPRESNINIDFHEESDNKCDKAIPRNDTNIDTIHEIEQQTFDSSGNRPDNMNVTSCVSLTEKLKGSRDERNVEANARSENRKMYAESNEFLAEKLFKMHSDDKLEQDDSFYFTYERNDDPGTPISLGDGSLMEEFTNDSISCNSSYS
ncbi:hypothetical protein PUN28_016382 [Cardiocondyla obscurior]